MRVDRSGWLWRFAAAAAVGVVVAGVGVWAQNSALVGINYDDGIYALLAKALAGGDGYRLTFLPVELPGIMYPPVYPLSLAPFWTLAGSQESALAGMKVANGLYIGLAAGVFTFLLVDLRVLPVPLAVAVALLSFVSGTMMLVTAGVLSEPLYMVLLFAAIWVTDGGEDEPGVSRLAAAGILCALVVLTRTVGVAVVAAMAIGLWRRYGWKTAGKALAVTVLFLTPWLAFTVANSGQVPTALVPRYGSYLQLYLSNIGGSPGFAFEIFSANVGAILQTLGAKLIPQFGPILESVTGAVLVGLAMLGSVRIVKNAPTAAIYPWIYLALISVWSFPPFRFLFILFPLLLALAVVSLPMVAARIGAGLGKMSSGRIPQSWPRYGVIGLAVVVLAGLGFRDTRAVARRVWDGAELDKSAAGAEVIDWVSKNTGPHAVVAYEFDPLIALHTGRKVVPNNYEPVHIWYRTASPPVEPLARMFSEMGVGYVAVRLNVPLAAAPIDALVERYPDVLNLSFVTQRGAAIFETDLEVLRSQLDAPDGVDSVGAASEGEAGN
jgi:hypothetical protein